ncbi:MAG TPA: hypothetical protein VFA89_06255 [Terriglobales bacterium]|nr:hypothetical protein [Terriglobales bacterium]
MPGYSGTPLPKKLGIKSGARVALLNMPANVRGELKSALATCKVLSGDEKSLDFISLFVNSQRELKKNFSQVSRQLAPCGMLWVSWPKKSSGLASDLDENIVREIGLNAGLVDVKVCAVDDVWSGLKFVFRLKDRPAKSPARK